MTTQPSAADERDRRIAALEAELATSKTKLAAVTSERDKLRRAYEQLKEELELVRRRLYVAKAERVDVRQLEIEFAQKKAALATLAASLQDETPPPDDERKKKKKSTSKPKGRRDLFAVEMPEERIEILDPTLEGNAERIGFEESCRLGHRRASAVRIVVARATYKTAGAIVTTKRPRELFERCLLAPSMFAHVLMLKYGFEYHSFAARRCSPKTVSTSDERRCAAMRRTPGRRSEPSCSRCATTR